MRPQSQDTLYEQVSHQSDDLPLKVYHTNRVYLHWHEEYEFILVDEGSVACLVNGEAVELDQHKALLLHSGDLHAMHNRSNARVTTIVVSPSFWDSGDFPSLFGESTRFQSVFSDQDPFDRSVIQTLRDIVAVYDSKPYGYAFVMKAKFSGLFASLITARCFTGEVDPVRQIPGALKSLIRYVHGHYTEKITLETLSALSFYSETYVIKLFKKYTDLTPTEYITQYRLDMAKKLLRSSSESNLSIALACGFSSEGYFIRAFKKRCGMTPGEYRRTSKKTNPIGKE